MPCWRFQALYKIRQPFTIYNNSIVNKLCYGVLTWVVRFQCSLLWNLEISAFCIFHILYLYENNLIILHFNNAAECFRIQHISRFPCIIVEITFKDRSRSSTSHVQQITNCLASFPWYLFAEYREFLADRTNGRSYATMLRLSVVCLCCG